MFERFTFDARRVIALANEEAAASGHPFISTGHLLLGVLRVGDEDAVVQSLRVRLGDDLDPLRTEIRLLLGSIDPTPVRGQRTFLPETRRALEEAAGVATSWGEVSIRPVHVLDRLLAPGETVASLALGRAGVLPVDCVAPVAPGSAVVGADEIAGCPSSGSGDIGETRWTLPAVVELQQLLGRSDTAAVAVANLCVSDDGMEWRITVFVRGGLTTWFPPGAEPRMGIDDPGVLDGPGLLCEIFVEYDDGRRAQLPTMAGSTSTGELVARRMGCIVTRDRLDIWFCVTPLPHAGSVTVDCSWSAESILTTRTTIDGDLIREAARRARRLRP